MAETITWVDADGTEHNLLEASTTATQVLLGVEGRFAPTFEFVEDEIPLQAGSRLRSVKTPPREVVLPLLFRGASETALRAALRTWLLRFHPARGDGRLRVTGPGGDQRELTCRYAGGMELVEDENTRMPTWQKAVVVFHAFDPYWYDTSDTTGTYTTGTAAAFFPIFPIRLSSSEVFADATVDNSGDVDAWPIWTITGPGSALVLRNLTTGKTLSLTYTLTAGQTIDIDTRPGAKTVLLDGVTNLYQYLSTTSALWPLEQGSNSVRVELTGATAASSVVLRYKRRWLGA